ncbi:hypothetical protein Tco_0246816 [Tanacetum coccineum]
MSNSEDSTVTYTAAPPSPDYVPGPEEPEQAPLLPEFFPKPVYPEFMPPEDDVLPTKEQPLPVAVSPTANSPGYIPESDPEKDPEEDDDEDPEEDPADYLTDRDDDDDEEEEPSGDEANDEDEDNKEEEDHPTSADFIPPKEEGPRYEVEERSSAPRPTRGFRADYGFVATLDAKIRRDPEKDDARAVLSGRLNLLQRDRRSHAYTALLMEREARLSPDKECSLAISRPRSTGTACGDTETNEYTADIVGSTAGTAETCWRSSTT